MQDSFTRKYSQLHRVNENEKYNERGKVVASSISVFKARTYIIRDEYGETKLMFPSRGQLINFNDDARIMLNKQRVLATD